jgi:hypothetical protein
MSRLGRVDGFDQDEAANEGDQGAIVLGGLFAAQGEALEAFELSHGVLDAGAGFVEGFGKEGGLVGGIGTMRDDRTDAALAGGLAVGLGIVALVGDCGAGPDVRSDVEQNLKLPAVAGLTAGQMEVERQARAVGLEVDFGREPAARAAERLALLPPLAPAAETCARTTVLSNIWRRCALSLRSASNWKNASNTPRRLSRQNRFHTLFQFPNSFGSARQVMLWTEK